MLEASDILDLIELTDEWKRLSPPEWNVRALATDGEVYQFNKELGDGEYRRCIARVQQFLLKCDGENPTDAEINQLFDMVKAKGEPVTFFRRLSIIRVPEFADGKDPTVKEFFEGVFDPSDIKVKSVLLIYPLFEVTQ